MNRRLRAKILKRKRDGPERKEVEKYLIEKCGLTKANSNFWLGKKKRPGNWTAAEIIESLVLRKKWGTSGYQHARKRYVAALPSITTLRKRIAHFRVSAGEIASGFTILRRHLANKQSWQKVAVVMYDEIAIASDISFDEREEQFIKGASKMQVVMLRGLLKNFKIPLYIGFDEAMTPEILKSVISRAERAGAEVVSTVSDMATDNQGLWKKMGVTMKKPWMTHHDDASRKIFCFADSPHCLKNGRNHLLDTGYILPDELEEGGLPDQDQVSCPPMENVIEVEEGDLPDPDEVSCPQMEEAIEADPQPKPEVRVTKQELQDLFFKDQAEFKMKYKLSSAHFDCVGAQRQRVKLAAELFSSTVAADLKLAKKDKFSTFIKTFNDWFDTMNSRRKIDPQVSLRSAYGGEMKAEQDKVLKRMHTLVTKMRAITKKGNKKKGLCPFQKGIAMGCTALPKLWDYLHARYPQIKYLLTCRLNQDALENFFSRVRGLGRTYHHPSGSEALSRVRLLMVTQDANFVVESAPVAPAVDEDSEEIMLAAAQLDDFREEVEGDDADWADVPMPFVEAEVGPHETPAEVPDCDERPPIMPDVHGDFLEPFGDDEDPDAPSDDMVIDEPTLTPDYDGADLLAEDLAQEADELEEVDLPDLDEVSCPQMEDAIEAEDQDMEPAPEINPAAEGFSYWAGWLASKFRVKHRDLGLGMPTEQLEHLSDQSAFGETPVWLGTISRGGLTVPSLWFKEMLLKFEDIFQSIHGNELSYEKGVITKLQKLISLAYPEMPADLVRTYARSRSFLRMRYLNHQVKEQKAADSREKKAAKAKKAAENAAAGGGPPQKKRVEPTSASAAIRQRRETRKHM